MKSQTEEIYGQVFEEPLFTSLSGEVTEITCKCTSKNQALYFCVNPLCKSKQKFTCCTRKCPCHKQHLECLQAKVDFALQKINQKITKSQQLKNYIQTVIDRMIDDLSLFRELLIKQVDEMTKTSSLHKSEKKFLSASQSSKTQPQKQQQLTSIDTSQLWQILTAQNQYRYPLYTQTQHLIDRFQAGTKSQMTKITQQIKSIIQNQQILQTRRSMFSKHPQAFIASQIFTKSKICNSIQTANTLVSFFDKKIKKIQLLYRASENGFSLPAYYDKCSKIPNTIIMVQTDKDKIFGGYTPLSFEVSNDIWISDPSKQTFLFSVSQGQKFTLIQQRMHQTIFYYSNKQQRIRFGQDFLIQNNATIERCLVGQLHTFQNKKFVNSEQSYRKLNGNPVPHCLLKEWEVFKLEFYSS